MDYLKLLKESYAETIEKYEEDLEPYEYLSEHIFNFTTYDSEISNKMGEIALSICLAITDKKTFEFIRNELNYANYLIYINLVFFKDKLEWGTSVRGAWWDNMRTFEINSCGLYENGEQVCTLELNVKEWGLFIYAMRDFVQFYQQKQKTI